MNRLLKQPGERLFYLAATLASTALLGYGYHLQYNIGLAPCPLCILQRLAFMGVLLCTALALLHGLGKNGLGVIGRRIYSGLGSLCAGLGAGLAARQVWLQQLPAEQVPECGPGLDFLLQALPLTEALGVILQGSGECAQVHWTFLSLSIAEWSLFWFLLFFIALLTHTVKP